MEQAVLLTADGASKCEQGMKTLTVPRAVAQLCLKSWETADAVNGAVYQWSQIKQRMAKKNASKASLQVQTCHYI